MPKLRLRLFLAITLASLTQHIAHAEKPFPDPPPLSNPPTLTFRQAETPPEMFGMLLAEGLAGMGAGVLAGTIMADRAEKHCKENIDPNFSDECGWSGLGGFMEGFLIAAPLGQGLGVMLAGAIEHKQGNGILTVLTAYGGDLASFLLFAGVYNVLDGAVSGKGDQMLVNTTIAMASATMLALPILTYTVSDYHVRFPMRPKVGWSPGGQGLRLGLQIAEVKF